MKSSVLYALISLCRLGYVAATFQQPPAHEKVGKVCSRTSSRAENTRLHMSVPNALDTLTSGFLSILRMPSGVTVSPDIKPKAEIRLMKLYDIENSRACRNIREQVTELDLVVEKVIPAADNSRAITDPTFEDALPTSAEVPSLEVSLPSGEARMISGESNIAAFLEENFPCSPKSAVDEANPLQDVLQVIKTAGSYAAGWLRPGRGNKVSPAVTSSTSVNRPKKPLILYSYEGNQFCRLVREVLTELDIAYELRSAGKESPRRAELSELTGGSTMCPYIVDPNTGVAMAESALIIRYLYDTYALWTPPNELLEWASEKVIPLLKPLFSSLAPLQAGANREDRNSYQDELGEAVLEIEAETAADLVVVYTYDLSPFCFEAKSLLESLDIKYKEISLGKEWVPGFIAPGGAIKRAALLEMTGQSSLPHIFVGGKSIGGLFGETGLVSAVEEGTFLELTQDAKSSSGEVGAFE
jgi:glutaredoxin